MNRNNPDMLKSISNRITELEEEIDTLRGQASEIRSNMLPAEWKHTPSGGACKATGDGQSTSLVRRRDEGR